MNQDEARAYFPRGLEQPEGGYRFSLDSLLLGCFARMKRGWTGVDIGCGAGAVSIAALLANPEVDLTIHGVEADADAAACARNNAKRLDLAESFLPVQADVCTYRELEQQADFALMNPPFREAGRGRVSRGESRSAARFETGGSLADFVRCAALQLKSRGRLFTVFLPERLPALFREMDRRKLAPKRLIMVHGTLRAEAGIVLVEAVKNGGEGVSVTPPLILYGEDGCMTRNALEFCPFLACNAKGDCS